MNIPKYIEQMIVIQKSLLEFIKNDKEENFHKLTFIIENEKIIDNKYDFKSFLHLISKISNNHYRFIGFYNKIEQLLSFYRNQIQNYCTNDEIFNIFKNNKRILLYLFDEKIIILDQYILHKISNKKYEESNYIQYFMPEINLLTKINDNEIPDHFEEKRKTGENDSYICKLIRNDSIEEFIAFANKNNINLDTKIELSIYETNPFLIKNKEQNLIEYAAFFGSFQIFQYLMNQINLTSSLWKYAIHGQNPDIIHLLEDNHIECNNETNIIESIKCHHNKLVNDFLNMDKRNDVQKFLPVILKYYNFEYLKKEMINETAFFDFCKYDYFLFAQFILPHVSINEAIKCVKKGLRNDFLSRGISNPYIESKKTALHISVEKENIEIVKLLLTCEDIDVNLLWKSLAYSNDYPLYEDKKTSLHIAVEKENIEIVKILLSCTKIDVNCIMLLYKLPYHYNETPLHIAVRNENVEIVKLLLSCKNIDPNIYWNSFINNGFTYSIEEMTALYIAVKKENLEIVKTLCLHPSIDIGKPFRVSTFSGEQVIQPRRLYYEKKTPINLASSLQNKEILDYLNEIKKLNFLPS